MINRLRARLQRYFQVRERYDNPIERQRAAGLLLINLAILALGLVVSLFVLFGWFGEGGQVNLPFLSLTLLAPAGIFTLIYVLINRGQLRNASRLVVFAIGALVLPSSTLVSVDPISQIFPVITPIVAAGVLLERPGIVLTTIVVLLMVALGPLIELQATSEIILSQTSAADGLGLVFVNIIFSALLLFTFSGNVSTIIREALLDNRRVRAIAELQEQIKPGSDEATILNQMLDTLRRDFGYSLVQVYRLDETGMLSNQLGEQARQPLATYRSYSLNTGNALSRAAREQEIIRVSAESPETEREHFMLDSLVGLAVPMVHQGRTIGVIDIQSATALRFSVGTLNALQLLAEDIAASVNYVRQLRLLQRSLQEERSASAGLREQLREVRRQSAVLVGDTWDTYLQQRGKRALGYDLAMSADAPTAATDLPADLMPVFENKTLIEEQTDTGRVLKVPIVLRGEVMGAMAFTLPGNKALNERQRELAQQVASRLASALENKRLFEQVEAQARRERKANESGAMLLSSTDVDTVLALAAANFQEALGAINAQIFLQPGALTGAARGEDTAV